MNPVRNPKSVLGAGTLAGGRSGVTGRSREEAGVMEVEREENRERGGDLHGPTRIFDESVQEYLNSE